MNAGIDQFHDFFLGCAGVAGALIGLLFVAISVVPEGIGAQSGPTARLRPAAALSAFVNALVVSLLAIVPGLVVASVIEVMSLIGLAAMLGLLVLAVSERRDAGPLALVRPVVALVGQGVVYGFQFAAALALATQPDSLALLDREAILLVILFVLGINRAWEYVGANTPSLLRTLVAGLRRP